MKLLVLTQKVDKSDPVLGFFHHWLEEFAKNCEQLIVICLEQGVYDLPQNVKVLSLGKEKGQSKFKYLVSFYSYLWQNRNNYQSVFVHMNQEYVLLAGVCWRLTGKKIILWRNHPSGNFLATIAVWLANVVCCTSRQSYTAKFKKTKIMPVGIDTSVFHNLNVIKEKNSILFLSRMSSIKNPDVLLRALALLKQQGFNFKAYFYGEALSKDQNFYQALKQQASLANLDENVFWQASVNPQETLNIYNQFEVFVNLTRSGSMDKTIFEAMACETITLTSNESLRAEIPETLFFKYQDHIDLAEKIKNVLLLNESVKNTLGSSLRQLVVAKHDLKILINKLFNEFKG